MRVKTIEEYIGEILQTELNLSDSSFVYAGLDTKIKNPEKDFFAITILLCVKRGGHYDISIQLDFCSYPKLTTEEQQQYIEYLTNSKTSKKLQEKYKFVIHKDSFKVTDLSSLQKLKFNRYVFRFGVTCSPKYIKQLYGKDFDRYSHECEKHNQRKEDCLY